MTVKSHDRNKRFSRKSLQSEASSYGLEINLNPNENLHNNSVYNASKQSVPFSPYISKKENKISSRNTKASENFVKVGHLGRILPINVNKANSDEFKNTKQMPRKTKKSVLTLPNKQLPLPQTCTVSDMNDSEYFQESNYNKEIKSKKKQHKNKRKSRSMWKNMVNDEVNDSLDCGSCSLRKQFYGDGIRTPKNKKIIKNKSLESNVGDVWSIVKNINKFRFLPSPATSLNSDLSQELYKNKKRLTNNSQRNGAGWFYYDDTNSCSQSSFDRITVIDKENELHKNTQQRDGKKSQATRKSNITETNQTQRSLNEKVNYNKFYSEKRNKYNDIKLWIKKINPLNSNILTLHYKNNNEFQRSSENINEQNTKNEAGEQTTNYKGVRTHSAKSQSPTLTSNERKRGSARNIKQSMVDINGITKVVLNKQKRTEITKAKAAKTSSSVARPRYTQTEVKRRLATLKFPIVILEKDQVSSFIKVIDYEAPQFSGLNDHKWPFMEKWLHPVNILKKDKLQSKNINGQDINEIKAKYRNHNEEIDDDTGIFHKPTESKITLEGQLTDATISTLDTVNNVTFTKYTKITHRLYNKKLKDASTDTSTHSLQTKSKVTVAKTVVQQPPIKYTWASARRASEFIENIIKKIKNGVYFNQELEILKRINIDSRNNWTQTETKTPTNNSPTDRVPLSIELQECLDSIPGFEKEYSDLKIETFNTNQIAIKHCKTNVVVKFDIVTSQAQQNQTRSKRSITFKPMLVVESKAKVYKCDKRIINTGLPAELCSILPIMLRDLSYFNKNVILPKIKDKSKVILKNDLNAVVYVDKSLPIHNTNNKLCVNGHILKHVGHKLENANTQIDGDLESVIYKPVHLNAHVQGHLLQNVIHMPMNVEMQIEQHIVENIDHKAKPKRENRSEGHFVRNIAHGRRNYNTQFVLKPMSRIDKSDFLLDICSVMEICLPKFILRNVTKYEPRKNDEILETIRSQCTAIQLYSTKDKQLIPAYKRFNLLDLLNITKIKNNLKVATQTSGNFEFNIRLWDTTLYRTVELLDQPLPQIKDNIYDTCDSDYDCRNTNVTKSVLKNKKYNHIKTCAKTLSNIKAKVSQNNYSSRKLSNIQKCKRCKSMFTIREAPHTLLNDITNIHEFFQVLGSAKTLCNVMDKDSEGRILTSLAAMSSWTTCITPTQALLVLLLVTKKESPNLIRYRLLILHGIAVNRITLVSELNMEIEVIENEDFNKFPQFSGMNYLPESFGNQDALLEELLWIAKTTASDYQKCFDECSEKYLRSLLEKRRKLNPSYLRVMARYVGLGLLKKSK